MADAKVTALTEDSSPGLDSLLYSVKNPGGTPLSRKITLQNTMELAPHWVERESRSGYDYTDADLTTDGSWHDLDLSSIVPEGAVKVAMRFTVVDNSANMHIQFRKNGDSSTYNQVIRTQVNGVSIDTLFKVFCDSSRVIEYEASNTTFSEIGITIIAWYIDTVN